jgi:hypothetical protein
LTWTPGAHGGPKGLTLGPIDMPTGGIFEIGRQIILLKIDGFHLLKLLCRKKGTPRQLKWSYCRTIVRSLASRNSNGQCLKAFFENYPDVLKSVYSIGNYDPELGSLFDSMYYNSFVWIR